jgi:hypothetical protein
LGKYSHEFARKEFSVIAQGIALICLSVSVAIRSSHAGSLNKANYRRIDTLIDMMTVAGFNDGRIAPDGDPCLLGPADEFLERALSTLPKTLTNPFDFVAQIGCPTSCGHLDTHWIKYSAFLTV